MGLKQITATELVNLNKINGGFKSVLDVGCGNQIYKQFIDFDDYVGIDVEVSGHPNDQKKVDLFFDGVNIPFSNEKFDLIICTEVLEHALNPDELVLEMKRVLKADGMILITVPSMWGEHETPFDFRRYTSFGIKKMMDDMGLHITKFQKERPGVLAFITLGLSEINASKNGRFIKKIANLWLKVSFIILKHILNIEMPRIYLTNLIVCEKSNLKGAPKEHVPE